MSPRHVNSLTIYPDYLENLGFIPGPSSKKRKHSPERNLAKNATDMRPPEPKKAFVQPKVPQNLEHDSNDVRAVDARKLTVVRGLEVTYYSRLVDIGC